MMTLEEAIIHAEEVAEKNEKRIRPYKCNAINEKLYEVNKKEFDSCLECAKEHRQLAEWLKELKAKRKLLSELLDGEPQRYKPIILQEHDAEPRTMRAIMDMETEEIYVYGYSKRTVDMVGMTIEEVNADEDSD